MALMVSVSRCRLQTRGRAFLSGRPVVATTGGYLTGWVPKFAADLCGKNVVIMYGSNEDGLRLYADIANSLDAYSIAYRRINVPQNGSMSVAEIG